MNYETYEKKKSRKWHQMTDEEKSKEIEMVCSSSHHKLMSLLIMQKMLRQII